MGWVKHLDEFLGVGSPFFLEEEEVEVESVDFEMAGGSVYVLVKLTDGYVAPVLLTEEQKEKLKKMLEQTNPSGIPLP